MRWCSRFLSFIFPLQAAVLCSLHVLCSRADVRLALAAGAGLLVTERIKQPDNSLRTRTFQHTIFLTDVQIGTGKRNMSI